jgi:hypothetical protein
MAAQLYAVRLAEYDIHVFEIVRDSHEDMTEPVRAKYDELIRQGVLLQKRGEYRKT